MPYITEERRMIQEQAREFTLNEVLPVANKLDPEKGDMPMDLRDKMAELGYFGILIPEKYGGLGLGCFEYCLVTEELSRACLGVSTTYGAIALGTANAGCGKWADTLACGDQGCGEYAPRRACSHLCRRRLPRNGPPAFQRRRARRGRASQEPCISIRLPRYR